MMSCTRLRRAARHRGPLRLVAALALAVALLVSLPLAAPQTVTALAQATQNGAAAIDYAEWDRLAGRAEAALESARTSEDDLDTLRAQIVAQRTQFLAAQAGLQEPLVSVREQIAALGPLPAEGASESDEIVQRRAALNEVLASREAPLRAADEALARAESIIRQIDRELRARQADALMALGPTPLSPAGWLDGFDSLRNAAGIISGEARDAWQDPARRAEMISDLPLTLGTLALAALFLLRGRRWMETLTVRLLQSTTFLRGRVVAAFFASLSQLIVPFAGLLLLALAIGLTRMTGPTIEAVAAALVPAGMAVFFARWLSLHIFPIIDDPRLYLNLDATDRRRARALALIFGSLAAAEMLFAPLIAPQSQSPSALATLTFPLIVLNALTMIRFGRLLQRHTPGRVLQDGVEVDVVPFFDRVVSLGSRALVLFGILAPVLGAVGYIAAATMLTYPPVRSLAVIGLVIVGHRLIVAIWGAIVGDDERAGQGLVPSLTGLVLSLLALIPLSLIWGARETDLLELWTRFSAGTSLGGARISPASVLWFFIVFAIGSAITRMVQGTLGTSVLPKTSMEKGAQKAIVSGTGYLGIAVAALVAFSVAGIDLSGLAIVAGALSVGVGFGLQNIVSNFVSGIILLIERPVSEGDWIEVGPTQGIVERISVRSTMIETFDKSKVIVPNADLISGAVTNYTKSSRTGRLVMKIGVAYGSDTRKVQAILREIIENEPVVVLDPAPGVDFLGFGADSMDFQIRAIVRDVSSRLPLQSEVNHKIAERFAAEGIEIPFAQRDIWIRNPEALFNRPPRGPAAPEPAGLPEPAPDRDTADSAAVSVDEVDPPFREQTR